MKKRHTREQSVPKTNLSKFLPQDFYHDGIPWNDRLSNQAMGIKEWEGIKKRQVLKKFGLLYWPNESHLGLSIYDIHKKQAIFWPPPPAHKHPLWINSPSLIQTMDVQILIIIEILHVLSTKKRKIIALHICNYCIYLWKKPYLQIKLKTILICIKTLLIHKKNICT